MGDIGLTAVMNNPGYEPPEYSIRIAPHGPGYAISEETLSEATPSRQMPFKRIDARNGDIQFYDPVTHRLQKPDWEYDALESA